LDDWEEEEEEEEEKEEERGRELFLIRKHS
jgi:hypothetical protein